MWLYDQVYWLLKEEGVEHYSPVALVPEVAPYVIHVDAISKSFAATGLPEWAGQCFRPLFRPK